MQTRHPHIMRYFRLFVERHTYISLLAVCLLLIGCTSNGTPSTTTSAKPNNAQEGEPGTKNGTTRLINNWTITPAGKQSQLGDLPLNAILSPDGRFLLVANSGTGVQSLQIIGTGDNKVVQTITYDAPHSVFIGLAYSPDGKSAYAAGGGEDVVHTFSVSTDGNLKSEGDITMGTLKENPFPTGLSISLDGKTLYVANNLANNVALVDTESKKISSTIKIGTYPYATLVSKDGKTIYASNWGDATVSVIDAANKSVSATIPVGQHPSALALSPDGQNLYVSDSNSDEISVIDTENKKETRKISVAPTQKSPLSSSPQGLTVSPDGKSLYVVDAGNNEVVVIGTQEGSVQGRIPTAWYPTSVNVSSNSGTLYVTNAKGLGAGPNNKGDAYPDPTRKSSPIVDAVNGNNDKYCNCSFDNYSGAMIVGTLSTIAVPAQGQLRVYTDQVARNDRQNDASITERSNGNPIPQQGGTSPIKHVIYIVKENRTYDQVFGDEKVGDGDSKLTLFPKNVTPNIHALAERFGLLDNFYADAEVSADGHNWINSANATDYNEKMWPQDYSPGKGRNRTYDFEGDSKINLSPGGYIWDAAAEARITYRDYGEFYKSASAVAPVSKAKLIPTSEADSCSGPIAHSYSGKTVPDGQVLCFQAMQVTPNVTPNLDGHFDPKFRTFDSNYREADRVAEWQREFNQFVTNNNLPQFEILRFPNDHTQGTAPGKLTPQAAVAENDNAVGKVIDILSHSKYWADTAVFITEDDAQNGPDHVDAHRTESLVISPYTSRSQIFVDHTIYDTAAMVRTMELILGLRPLSQYDANAVPMWRLFNSTADTKPYTAADESVTTSQLNSATAYGSQASAMMDFSQEDRIPMDQLNQILWHAVKGADVPYPSTSAPQSKPAKDSEG
ncbi:MAG: alkaline phosphatase family protein [Ktedonobacteraceae bacterium]